jgi:predicted amino acid-binding ACT domain protein
VDRNRRIRLDDDVTVAAWGFEPATIRPGGIRVTVWFTVRLEDRPGSLARVASALGERGVNITGIVGVAEDTDGSLMLTTSDASATRAAFDALDQAYEEHDPTGGIEPDRLTVADMSSAGGSGRGADD